jgi:hypothetical protein
MSDVVDGVKATTSGPGKKWIIVGAVAGLGYLWWTRSRSGTATKPAGGAATITPGGTAAADPVTPPAGDYSPATAAVDRPTTNAEWLSRAVDTLTAAPYNRPAIATWNALNKALAGQPLTTAESAIVELAIQAKGTPPEGMPPIQMSSTASPTGTDTTPIATKLAAPTNYRDTGPVWQTSLELHWDQVVGATAYRIADFFTNATILDVGNVTATMWNGLVRNGTYYTKIAAKDANGVYGDWSTMLTSKTKI